MYPLKNKLAMYGLYAVIVVGIVSGSWLIYASQQPKKEVSRVNITSASSFSTRSASASVSSSVSASASSSVTPLIVSSSVSSSASSESSSLFSSQIVAPPAQIITSEPVFVPPASQQLPASSTTLPPVVISSQAVSVAPPTSTTPISSSSTPPPPVSSIPPPVSSSSSSTAPQPSTFSVTKPYASPGGTVTVVFSLTTLSKTITGATTTFQSGDSTSQSYVSTFNNGFFSKVSGKTIAELNSVFVSGASLTSGAFDTALASFKQQAGG